MDGVVHQIHLQSTFSLQFVVCRRILIFGLRFVVVKCDRFVSLSVPVILWEESEWGGIKFTWRETFSTEIEKKKIVNLSRKEVIIIWQTCLCVPVQSVQYVADYHY